MTRDERAIIRRDKREAEKSARSCQTVAQRASRAGRVQVRCIRESLVCTAATSARRR